MANSNKDELIESLTAQKKQLLEALSFYTSICGNTCYSVTRQTAMEMHDKATKAFDFVDAETHRLTK